MNCKHAGRTNRILARIVAQSVGGAAANPGNGAAAGQNPASPVPASGGGQPPPAQVPQGNGGGAGGNGANGGGWSWSRFFEGLTFVKSVSLLIAVILGVTAFKSVTSDIPQNKLAESQAYYGNLNEMEKTKQMKILAESAPQAGSLATVVANSCMRLTDVSAGKGYMLAKGECFTMPATPNNVYIGAESPITSISGGDFIVTTNDESSSCDSRQSADHCSSWIKQNQVLGGKDSRLHKPRYWTLVKPVSGEVDVKTRA